MALKDRTKELIKGALGDPEAELDLINEIEFQGQGDIKANGSVPFTGTQTGVTPIAPTDLATKAYVDSRPSTGVTSLNSETGALTLIPGSGITVTPSGSNITIASTNQSFTSTATAAGTTTLTASSSYYQFFTGSAQQTVVLPVAATLVAGQSFFISNGSTSNVTVETSDFTFLLTLTDGQYAIVTCVNPSGGTGIASWGFTFDIYNHTIVPVTMGGTGTTTSPTPFGVTYAPNNFQYATTAAGTTGQVLTATTGAAPSWENPAASFNILVFTSTATVGGAASEAVTVTGLLSTDTILSVSQKTGGGAALPILGWSTQVNGGITVIYSADMGSGAVVLVAVKR